MLSFAFTRSNEDLRGSLETLGMQPFDHRLRRIHFAPEMVLAGSFVDPFTKVKGNFHVDFFWRKDRLSPL